MSVIQYEHLANSKDIPAQVVADLVNSVRPAKQQSALRKFTAVIDAKLKKEEESIAKLKQLLEEHEGKQTRLLVFKKVIDRTLARRQDNLDPLLSLPVDLLLKIFKDLKTIIIFSRVCRKSHALYPEILARHEKVLYAYLNRRIERFEFDQLHDFLNSLLASSNTSLSLAFTRPMSITKHIKVLEKEDLSKILDKFLPLLRQKFERVEGLYVDSFWPVAPFLKQGFPLKRCDFRSSKEVPAIVSNTLESLSFSKRPTITQTKSIVNGCPRLTHLSIHSSGGNWAYCLYKLASSATLTSLQLDGGMLAIKENAKRLFSPSLTKVHLLTGPVNDEIVENLFTSSTQLRELELTPNLEGLNVMAPSSLVTLDLTATESGTNVLLQRCTHLKQLTLRYQPALDGVPFPDSLEQVKLILSNDQHVSGLAQLVSRCKTLKYLGIFNNGDKEAVINGIALNGLQPSPSLEHVRGILGQDGALIEQLFPNLKILDIHNPNILMLPSQYPSSHLGKCEEVTFHEGHPSLAVLKAVLEKGILLRKATFTVYDDGPRKASLWDFKLPPLLESIHIKKFIGDKEQFFSKKPANVKITIEE